MCFSFLSCFNSLLLRICVTRALNCTGICIKFPLSLPCLVSIHCHYAHMLPMHIIVPIYPCKDPPIVLLLCRVSIHCCGVCVSCAHYVSVYPYKDSTLCFTSLFCFYSLLWRIYVTCAHYCTNISIYIIILYVILVLCMLLFPFCKTFCTVSYFYCYITAYFYVNKSPFFL